MLLKHLLDEGLSKTAIARQVGVNRRTINQWVAEGKLEPYKPLIQARLERYPELTAVRLFEELKAAGYTGGISQLRDYVAQVRPRPAPEPLVRFETEPGIKPRSTSPSSPSPGGSATRSCWCWATPVCSG